MANDLGKVLALEIYTAAQALDYRREMINAARSLARSGDIDALIGKIGNAPHRDHASYPQFRSECGELMRQLAESGEFHPGDAVQVALATVRGEIGFMARDRAMDGDVVRICALVERGALRTAA
jgi:histidine ammonia-lyase